LVWKSDEVGEFVNSRFVSLRFSSSREKYWNLRSEYQIKGVPAVIILDSEGNEVGRMIGFSKKRITEYLQTLKDHAHRKMQIPTWRFSAIL
jgi:thioredoxin-related protein